MKHRQILIVLSLLLITLILTLNSCQDRPAAESTPFDTETTESIESTKSTETSSPSEKDYAFLQNPLCKQIIKSRQHEPFPPFRNAPNAIIYSTTFPPVPITATFPKTIVIDGKEYAVGEQVRHRGRDVGFIIKDAPKVFPSENDCEVEFDAITGEIVFTFNILLKRKPIKDIKSEDDLVRYAEEIIQEYIPTLNLNEYELDFLNLVRLEDGDGNVFLVRKINGIKTTDTITVNIFGGKVIGISYTDTHEFVGFDETLLNFDKEEHERMIRSFAEYVCNGYDLVSVETTEMTLVKEADDGYAIEYRLKITADTEKEADSRSTFDFRISLR